MQAPPSMPPPPAPPRRRNRFLKVVLILAVMAGMGFLGLVALFWMVGGPRVTVHDGTWIDVSFWTAYPEERPSATGLAALQGTDLSAQDLLLALREAGSDPRVEGILLRPDGFSGGWAQAGEVRNALLELRARGKRVVAYLEAPGPGGYYLATAADRVVIAPEGVVFVLGLSARMTYLRGTLEKLGMAADFVAVGEYKAAPEQYLREEASEESRRQISEYLDDLYAHWVEAMATGRGFTTERMTAMVDEARFDAEQALAKGLVDDVLDPVALEKELGATDALVDPLEYLSDAPLKGTHKIALIYAAGTIVPGKSRAGGWGGPLAGSDTVVDRLRRAREDDRVDAVVLRIDSPGGSATASDLMYREVLRVRDQKPVVVSMANAAASGGYYLAMAADRILAEPLTLTGSIGVYAGKFDRAGLYDKVGMSFEVLRRGENAGMMSDLGGFTPQQRTQMEEHLGRFYTRFLTRVATSRDLPVAEVDAVARGRVWSGLRAREVGLVDQLGGIWDAVAVAMELAGHDPDLRPELVTYQPGPSFLDTVLASLFREQMVAMRAPDPVMGWATRVLGDVERWWFTLDGTPQFHLTWQLEIR